MPIRIHSSNRVEKLQQSLCHRLSTRPLSSPLTSEIILVPTFAMSRWLNLRVAQHQGVAANIEYLLPAAWLWQVASQIIDGVPSQDPLAQQAMAWKIFAILPTVIDEAEFTDLNQYLFDDENGIKRWQLSIRIAELFDRYQQYRPQMIREWSSAQLSGWQATLWQKLIQDLHGIHRVAILSQLIDSLNGTNPGSKAPQRISLFAISSLPPLTIEVLLALSQHVDITFYQHSPTDQYFADLKSTRSLSRLGLSHPDEIEYYDTGNELLASWGRQAQTMQTLLLEQDNQPKQEIEDNYPPGITTLLQSIQQNIFDLGTTPINTHADDSIAIHICHSAMRECQVLHDQLLKILADNRQLGVEDILVMVPEISRYAPYIEAVFGYEDNAGKPYLPWNLSDISIIDEHPLVQSFLQLLHLPSSRFEISEIISLLEIAEIRKHFELDDAAVSDIQQWIDASRVRWGIDGSFKLAMGQPATIQNTWIQARQRLFTGYALGEDGLWNGIAALKHIDTGAALNISKFFDLFDRLDYWRNQLQRSAQVETWIVLLNRMLSDFYTVVDPAEDHLQEVRDCIDTLNLADNCSITSSLLRHWMEMQLGKQRRQGRLFSGGVTFCGMRPMRNLPFEVICLLGMNDNAFPRRLASYDFDILNQQHQLGDPSSGDEDRYLMLETLLSARHSFYMSYTGRSLKDNSECQPSVLVNEFIDFIDAQTATAGKLCSELIQLHPMQAFSTDNFTDPLFSYDTSWCNVARYTQKPVRALEKLSWPQKVRAVNNDDRINIDLKNLQRFLAHPIRYFINTNLKIFFERVDEYDNDESFSLDSISSWQLKSRLSSSLLKGRSDSYNKLNAESLLPHGVAGQIAFDNIQRQNQDWLQQLKNFCDIPRETIIVNPGLEGDFCIFGEIADYYPGKGLMHHSASRVNGSNFLKLWIEHLCLCATEQYDDDDRSYLITPDQTIAFTKTDQSQAMKILFDYCELFFLGQSQILPVFPKSSFAFALEADHDKALNKAFDAWRSSSFSPVKGDEEDDYIQLAIRRSDQIPLYHPAFEKYASAFYQFALRQKVTL